MAKYYVEYAEPHDWIDFFGAGEKANRRNWKLADVKESMEEAKSLAWAIRAWDKKYLTKIKVL
jgi:hypothetical protein